MGSSRGSRRLLRRGRAVVGQGALHAGELLVEPPALVGVRLRERQKVRRALGVRALEHREAGLLERELAQRDRGLARIELERLLVRVEARVEAPERPEAAAHGVALV